MKGLAIVALYRIQRSQKLMGQEMFSQFGCCNRINLRGNMNVVICLITRCAENKWMEPATIADECEGQLSRSA